MKKTILLILIIISVLFIFIIMPKYYWPIININKPLKDIELINFINSQLSFLYKNDNKLLVKWDNFNETMDRENLNLPRILGSFNLLKKWKNCYVFESDFIDDNIYNNYYRSNYDDKWCESWTCNIYITELWILETNNEYSCK